MKNLVLLFCLLLFFSKGYSQCTPNPAYTDPGFYPDSATGIAPGYLGVPYQEVITLNVPTDTTVDFPGVGIVTLTINTMRIDSVRIVGQSGYPVDISTIGLSYSCNSDSCQFLPNSSNCILISGQPAFPLELTYALQLYFTMNVTHALLGTFDAPQNIYQYRLNVGTPLDLISGSVYNDLNANCIQDVGEVGIPQRLVVATPGNNYAYTDAQGNYTLAVNNTGSFTITHLPLLYWNAICPQPNQSHTVTIDTTNLTIQNIDFGDTILNNINDMRVVLTNTSVARPGFPVSYHLLVSNMGTTMRTGALQFQHDNAETILSVNPPQTSYSNNVFMWDFGTIFPGQSLIYDVMLRLDSAAVLGTFIHLNALVLPVSDDIEPAGNSDSLSQIVQGSLDPNDKSVVPEGHISETMVDDQVYLTYTIRFQNTGNDTAFTVVIRDTLRQDLVMETFEFLSASHPVEYNVSYPQKMTFTFNNILLPDSNTNEPASHGFVKYRIRPKSTLSLGEEIHNTAYIYFDFNQPVVTNTVTTLVSNDIGFNEHTVINSEGINIFPNPATNIITVFTSTNKGFYQLVDITGKTLLRGTVNAEKFTLDISSLSSGVYFISVTDGERQVNGKIIKQ